MGTTPTPTPANASVTISIEISRALYDAVDAWRKKDLIQAADPANPERTVVQPRHASNPDLFSAMTLLNLHQWAPHLFEETPQVKALRAEVRAREESIMAAQKAALRVTVK